MTGIDRHRLAVIAALGLVGLPLTIRNYRSVYR